MDHWLQRRTPPQPLQPLIILEEPSTLNVLEAHTIDLEEVFENLEKFCLNSPHFDVPLPIRLALI